MNRWLSIKNWFVTQFKTHPLRSSLIASGIALALIAGSLLIFGIPRFGGLNLDQSGFDYLPDREYVLGAKEDERPQTLKELLYSQSPDIEDFLHSPNIAEELLAAENLVDIVDSRYALNNLREIDRQLEERTEEEDLPMGDLVTFTLLLSKNRPRKNRPDLKTLSNPLCRIPPPWKKGIRFLNPREPKGSIKRRHPLTSAVRERQLKRRSPTVSNRTFSGD